MNDRARQKLIQILDTESTGILEEPERLEAFLRDYCGDCRKEISALITALQEEIPRDLYRMRGEPYPILTTRLAGKLHEERSLVMEAAQWAVESWAFVLEIAPGSQRPRDANGKLTPVQPPVRTPISGGGFGGVNPSPSPWLPPASPAGAPEFVPPPWQTPVQNPPQNPEADDWQPIQFNLAPLPSPGPEPVWVPSAPPAPLNTLAAPQSHTPPQHNSFIASAVCFGLSVLILVCINSNWSFFVSIGPFLALLLLVFALAGGVELMLAGVRSMLNRLQPPSFVISSLSFWMGLFRLEDKMIRLVTRKHSSQPQIAQQPPAFPAPFQTLVSPVDQSSMGVSALASAPPPPASPGQADPNGVFCISCGKTNTPSSLYCLSCGEKLYHPDTPPDAAQA